MQNNLNRTSIFLFWLKGYLKLFSFSLLSLTGFRLLWFFNYKKGDELTHYLHDFLKALFLGLRFDLSALCYLTLPALLLWLIWFNLTLTPFRFDILKLQRRYWVFMLLVLLIILAADFHFYGYFQDHFNVLIFGFFQDDTVALIRTFWKNYPLIKIIITLTAVGWFINFWLLKLWMSLDNQSYNQLRNELHHHSYSAAISSRRPWILLPLFFTLFLSTFLGARGSLGLFPLEIMHTAISSNSFINSLSFNSTHALVHALQLHDQQGQKWNENLINLGYDKNPSKALQDFTNLANKSITELMPNLYEVQSKTHTDEKKALLPLPHVVFILMESWGSDWFSEQSPTFNILGAFEKHKNEDLFTTQILPSHVATIGSLGSLVIDLPHRLYSPFLTESAFLGVEFKHAPARFLHEKGYETHFIYGGNLGWRSIDQFLPRQGFQFLHGDHDIRKLFTSIPDENFTHDWGIHDEYVFKYANSLLEKATKPQFLFILTTTNHPPYVLPKNYLPPPLEFSSKITNTIIGDKPLAIDRLKAFQYSNQQLGFFLDQLKASTFSSNTIIAVTGDHSFYIRPYDNLQFFQKWSVPLYLYAPKKYLPNPTESHIEMGSHIDIFPTLYNLIFSDTTFYSLGHDLLDPIQKPWAFHTSSWSSFDQQFGIIINAKGEIINNLCKDSNGTYQPCQKSTSHESLKIKLNSLMGTADYLFENNKMNSQRTSNSTSGSSPINKVNQ